MTKGGGSVGEIMEKVKYPIRAEDYQLFEFVGQGVSAVVHRALCVPLDEIVAIKILDLERINCDLGNITREAQTMILIDHPNVLSSHCSFVNDHSLWVVMPYMAGGSCLHIMKSVYPDGFDEPVIATLLREVLKGVDYLHRHGHIHRDVKAGNILVDAHGGVKLGDFGVSACLFDNGDRQRSRNTFVGTPCWMAPEVMEQLHGYDFKADIWSFGITALELAHGHAPFSKYPPMKVLLMTLQNAPPGLDYERDKKFSKSFKQMIAMCLVKDPCKRPAASKLLKHPFFKQARSSDYLVRKILEGLPTLGVRHQALKDKDEDLLSQKKMPDEQMEELSQNEYKRGISGWNFDIEDLKAQASLIPDNDDTACKDSEGCTSSLFELDTPQDEILEDMSYSRSCSSNTDMDTESDAMMGSKSSMLSPPNQTITYLRSGRDGSDYEPNFPYTDDAASQNAQHFRSIDPETNHDTWESEVDQKLFERKPSRSFHERQASTSSCSSDILPINKTESTSQLNLNGSCNGPSDTSGEKIPKAPKSTASADESEDKSKLPIVQQRGRFKVMSETEKALPPLGLSKSFSLQVISPLATSTPSTYDFSTSNSSSQLFPQLLSILQANFMQRDYVLSLMKQVSCGDASEGVSITPQGSVTEKSLLEIAHEKEKELMQEIADLQWRLICIQGELQKLKSENAQV